MSARRKLCGSHMQEICSNTAPLLYTTRRRQQGRHITEAEIHKFSANSILSQVAEHSN